MASSSGRATVAPSPLRKVRRGNAILLMIMRLVSGGGAGLAGLAGLAAGRRQRVHKRSG